MMIGDPHYDVSGARSAGVFAVSVTWGFGDAAERKAAAPDRVITRPEELLALARG